MNLSEKYRPVKFSQVVGQESAVKQLEGMLASKTDFPSTLFLFGSSGVGKTCLARIVAAQLTGIEYKSDKDIESCPDINEMNIGDKRGIEDARSIAEMSRYKPTKGKKRVFILDEIQALTQASANALLKVMENPPPTTVFICLTNHPEKVLYTLKRRGPNIKLAAPDQKEVRKRVTAIAAKEKVEIDKRIILRIVKAANYNMAMSLNTLESVIAVIRAGGSAKEQNEAITQTIGVDIETVVYSFILACYTGNILKAMEKLHDNKMPIVDFCTKAMDVNAMITYHILVGSPPVDNAPKALFEALKKAADGNKINGNSKMWLHTSLSNLRSQAMNNQSIEDNHDLLAILLRSQK